MAEAKTVTVEMGRNVNELETHFAEVEVMGLTGRVNVRWKGNSHRFQLKQLNVY